MVHLYCLVCLHDSVELGQSSLQICFEVCVAGCLQRWMKVLVQGLLEILS